jgi:hypothetical protein
LLVSAGNHPVGDNGWQRKFEDPIPLPNGRQLVTFKDAADYIMKLPKKESELSEWQTAIEVLLLGKVRSSFSERPISLRSSGLRRLGTVLENLMFREAYGF